MVVLRVVADVARGCRPSRGRRSGARGRACRARPTAGPASSRRAGTGRSPRARCGSARRSTAGRRRWGCATARRRWRGRRRTCRRPGSCTSARAATPRSRTGSTRPGSPARRPPPASPSCARTSPGAGRPAPSWSACPSMGRSAARRRATSGSSTITARPERLLLEGDARAGRGGHAHRAAVAGADRRADGRDLVLGLERLDAEVLVARELVEDVRGGRDRVGAVEQVATRELRGGDEARAPSPRCR